MVRGYEKANNYWYGTIFSILIFTSKIQGANMVGLGAFNKEILAKADFDDVIMSEVKKFNSITKSDSVLIGINIDLPDASLINSIVQIRSLVMADYIYSGPYKKQFLFLLIKNYEE